MCKKNMKYPYFFNYLILFGFPQEINIISFKAGAKERLQEEKKEKKKSNFFSFSIPLNLVF